MEFENFFKPWQVGSWLKQEKLKGFLQEGQAEISIFEELHNPIFQNKIVKFGPFFIGRGGVRKGS